MRRLAPLLRLGVTGALLAWVLSAVELRGVAQTLESARAPALVAAFLLVVADRALMIAKWLPLLRVQAPDVRWATAGRVYLASGFASLFMPSVAADVIRSVALGRRRRAVPELGASIFAERMLGLLAGSVLAGLALVLVAKLGLRGPGLLAWAILATGLPPAIALASYLAVRIPWVRAGLDERSRLPGARLLRRFGAAYRIYRSHGRMVTLVWIASVIEQTIPIWSYVLIAHSLGAAVEPEMLWVAIPLVLFAARLPVTLWGLGVAEGGALYLLGLFSVPADEVLAMMLVGRALELVATLPGGLLWSELVRARAEE